jgi:hypothetical protein
MKKKLVEEPITVPRRNVNRFVRPPPLRSEEQLLKKYQALHPIRIVTSYYVGGVTETEIGLKDEIISISEAERRLPDALIAERDAVFISRAPVRINRTISTLQEVSTDELRLLQLTQKGWNSFRSSTAKKAVEEASS